MVPKVDSRCLRGLRFGPKFHRCWNQCFLYSTMLLAHGHPVHESLSPNEVAAELGQWHYKYFWNLSRNLNESRWLRVEICFLQSRPRWMKNLLMICLCVETLLSKCFSKLSLVWLEGSLIFCAQSSQPQGCVHSSFCRSWSNHSCCHFRSALRLVTPKSGLPWPCQEGETPLKRETLQQILPWKMGVLSWIFLEWTELDKWGAGIGAFGTRNNTKEEQSWQIWLGSACARLEKARERFWILP